jgi:hypothetical protein
LTGATKFNFIDLGKEMESYEFFLAPDLATLGPFPGRPFSKASGRCCRTLKAESGTG